MEMSSTELKDLTKSYLPLLFVIGLVLFSFQMGGTYRDVTSAPITANERITNLELQRKTDVDNINAAIARVATTVEEIRKTLADPASRGLPTDVVRFSDLYVFCLEMKINSPEAKIACPSTRN